MFKVHNDIVHALRFCNSVLKMGMAVDKSEVVIGSFAPTDEPHEVNLGEKVTPEGYFKRNSYRGKAMLADGDGYIHWQYEYPFKISKDW